MFIAVGTPPKESGETDLSHVEGVAAEIGRTMDRYKVVVNKSTVPVGTGELVREVITRTQPRPIEFDVVSNPEFLREGSAIEDTLRPDRIVIGAPTQQVAMTLVELYAPLERPMIITDLPSAEVIKYASNAFLAAKISFINAIANVCETAGADVSQVMKGIGLDSRIGLAFLQPGLGYGGSCFPKDVDSLIHTRGAARLRLQAPALRRRDQPGARRPPDRHDAQGARPLRGQDGGRARPRLQAEHRRHARGQEPRGHPDAPCRRRHVRAYDPVAMDNARALVPESVTFSDSAYAAAEGADAVALITEWNEFKYLNLERLRGLLRRPLIFDGRNLWEPERMRRLGFEYYSIGRKPVLPA